MIVPYQAAFESTPSIRLFPVGFTILMDLPVPLMQIPDLDVMALSAWKLASGTIAAARYDSHKPIVKIGDIFVAMHGLLKSVGFAILVMGMSTSVQGATKADGIEMQKPPDPEVAVRSEFERVKAKNTVEAYERFIRRHPDHALAEEARKAILRLKQ
ncbi:hypothetical protein GGE07_003105 [Sinorhizobium terangae]|nr:hypothetical protein [Sinorhizobium terangae]MBB4186446.1 hypothetical protein [Sinorhizobium terangae]